MSIFCLLRFLINIIFSLLALFKFEAEHSFRVTRLIVIKAYLSGSQSRIDFYLLLANKFIHIVWKSNESCKFLKRSQTIKRDIDVVIALSQYQSTTGLGLEKVQGEFSGLL